jgi:hypothetical protein
MVPEGSLPHSQEPATCPYPEPYQSSPRPPIPLLEYPFYYYPVNSSAGNNNSLLGYDAMMISEKLEIFQRGLLPLLLGT